MPLMVVLLGFGVYWIWGFFHKAPKTDKPVQAQTQVKPGQVVPSQSGAGQNPAPAVSVVVPAIPLRTDEITQLLEKGLKPRLLFFGIKDGKPVASVEFRTEYGREVFSQNDLQMSGWFLYFSADQESALLTEGTRVVIVRRRVGRLLDELRGAR
jgi:hypothetical protein